MSVPALAPAAAAQPADELGVLLLEGQDPAHCPHCGATGTPVTLKDAAAPGLRVARRCRTCGATNRSHA